MRRLLLSIYCWCCLLLLVISSPDPNSQNIIAEPTAEVLLKNEGASAPKEQPSLQQVLESADSVELHQLVQAVKTMLYSPSQVSPRLLRRRDLLDALVNRMIKETSSSSTTAAAEVTELRLLLADCRLLGKFGQPVDLLAAKYVYQDILGSEAVGELSAASLSRLYFLNGWLHSTALLSGGSRNNAKSLLYYTFASAHHGECRSSDCVMAHMALGYRYANGVGVEAKCESALAHYQSAADLEARYYQTGIISGHRPVPLKISLVDEVGNGLYGPGSSATNAAVESGESISIEDLIQYHQHNADRGDVSSQVILGQLYYFGRHRVEKNFDKAIQYFRKAAAILPQSSPSTTNGGGDGGINAQMRAAAQAVTFLGNMFWFGHGVKQDNATAAKFFKQASEFENADAMNNLGVMYLNGVVVQRDVNKAFKFYNKAVKLQNADAMVNLARLYLGIGTPDYETAARYLDDATKRGSILALYELGKLHTGRGPIVYSCQTALLFFKAFVDKADYDRPLLEDGYDDFKNGYYEAAFVKFLLAAELGYDIAQLNVAWMLENGYYTVNGDMQQSLTEAAVYYQRAANVGHVDARVKVGDMLFDGTGLDVNKKLALSFYQAAAEEGNSPIAWFNLGYMYQEGIMVPKDYHLSKRYYDRALAVNPNAYFPVFLAQTYLRLKHFGHWLMHGGSFYLDSLPAILENQPNIDLAKSEDSLLADIEKAERENVNRPADGDEGSPWNGRAEDEWNDYYPANEDDESDVHVIFLLVAFAFVLLWFRQQQPVVALQ